jgi:hypothetical protein
MTKAINYILERLTPVYEDGNDKAIVCGKITGIKVESNLLRQMGGSYTGDTIAASVEYQPEFLPCDFTIDNPDQKITEANSSVILVREVVKRLTSELDAVVCATMAEHEETLQEALEGEKEVPAETMLVQTTEVF